MEYLLRVEDLMRPGFPPPPATLTGWCVQVGGRVQRGASIFTVSTDKVDMELPSPVDGRIAALHGEVGMALKADTLLITFEDVAPDDPGLKRSP